MVIKMDNEELRAVKEDINNGSDNNEYESRAKKVFSRFGFAYLYAEFANTIFGSLIMGLLIKLVWIRKENVNVNANLLVSLGTLYILGFLPAFFLIRKIPKTDITKKSIGIGKWSAAVCIVYAVSMLCNILGIILNSLMGAITGIGVVNPISEVLNGMNPAILICFVAIIGPIVEELMFRKLLVDRICQYGEGITIFVSGMMFGLFHGNFAQFFYAFFIGVLLAYIYMRTGKIKYTIGIHIFINTMSSLLMIAMQQIDIYAISSYLDSGDRESYMNYIMQNMPVFAMLGLIVMFLGAITLIGTILCIVFRKKFYIKSNSGEIAKGSRLKTVLINPGMMIFVIYFITIIGLTQCGISLSSILSNLIL